jgi:hypothetical protein
MVEIGGQLASSDCVDIQTEVCSGHTCFDVSLEECQEDVRVYPQNLIAVRRNELFWEKGHDVCSRILVGCNMI